METLLGGMAAAIGVCISLPQIWKTHKTKKVSDVSLPMWVLLLLAQLCWMAYGFMRGDTILFVANVIVSVQTVTMLAMIHMYRH